MLGISISSFTIYFFPIFQEWGGRYGDTNVFQNFFSYHFGISAQFFFLECEITLGISFRNFLSAEMGILCWQFFSSRNGDIMQKQIHEGGRGGWWFKPPLSLKFFIKNSENLGLCGIKKSIWF